MEYEKGSDEACKNKALKTESEVLQNTAKTVL